VQLMKTPRTFGTEEVIDGPPKNTRSLVDRFLLLNFPCVPFRHFFPLVCRSRMPHNPSATLYKQNNMVSKTELRQCQRLQAMAPYGDVYLKAKVCGSTNCRILCVYLLQGTVAAG
jgi:hypothetical protein